MGPMGPEMRATHGDFGFVLSLVRAGKGPFRIHFGPPEMKPAYGDFGFVFGPVRARNRLEMRAPYGDSDSLSVHSENEFWAHTQEPQKRKFLAHTKEPQKGANPIRK